MAYNPCKCVYYWVGLKGCKQRQEEGCCCKECPYFVNINSPQGDLMLCEYMRQKELKDNKGAE